LLSLIVMTSLWGSTYVVIQGAIVNVPPSVVTLVRFGLASLCFAPFLVTPLLNRDRRLAIAGLELGVWIVAGYTTQSIGLLYTTVNRSAFITGLYVIGVPIFYFLLGQSVRWLFWLAAGMALLGIGLLSYEGAPPNIGDVWTLGTALGYTLYICRLEVYMPKFNVLVLSGAQLWGTTAIAFLWVAIGQTEWLTPANWAELPWRSLLYLGIVATALTTLVQTWGQRFVGPTHAAIIYALEPVWASVFALLVIGERLGMQGLLGAGAIIGATLLCQLGGAPPESSTDA
jgi:drug/metabolite transporter (DMT)-like permease